MTNEKSQLLQYDVVQLKPSKVILIDFNGSLGHLCGVIVVYENLAQIPVTSDKCF